MTPPEGRRFKKGKSGNPNGRPPLDRDVRTMARDYTEHAIKVLASIMVDRSRRDSARVAAAQAILDRAHGKPTQPMELGGPDGAPLSLTVAFVKAKA